MLDQKEQIRMKEIFIAIRHKGYYSQHRPTNLVKSRDISYYKYCNPASKSEQGFTNNATSEPSRRTKNVIAECVPAVEKMMICIHRHGHQNRSWNRMKQKKKKL